jgi:Bacteriophage CI repressor helix-turn-helix domain.
LVANLNHKGATGAEEQITRLIQAAGVKNVAALARELGISPQALSKYKKMSSVPLAWAIHVAEKFDVSLEWILDGEKGIAQTNFVLDAAKEMQAEGVESDSATPRPDVVIEDKDGNRVCYELKRFAPADHIKPKQVAESVLDNLVMMTRSQHEEIHRLTKENQKLQQEKLELTKEKGELCIQITKMEIEMDILKSKARAAPGTEDSEGLKESA